jgi:hypothetical protein
VATLKINSEDADLDLVSSADEDFATARNGRPNHLRSMQEPLTPAHFDKAPIIQHIRHNASCYGCPVPFVPHLLRPLFECLSSFHGRAKALFRILEVLVASEDLLVQTCQL